jgi:hypothetical protein
MKKTCKEHPNELDRIHNNGGGGGGGGRLHEQVGVVS